MTTVLDTNVLLSDPDVIRSFHDTDVIVPETVLAELDKLKTSRVDPDLRFRGREVSRLLFDLSEQGNLAEGVPLPDGGQLRVLGLESDFEFPEGLSPKNADDRILAVAVQQMRAGEDVVLVTNDLNMLLKAQTLGVEVERHFDGVESTFARRFIIRPFQRYKVPIGILAVALAVFVSIIVLSVYILPSLNGAGGQPQVPQEFKDQLSQGQRDVLDELIVLQQDPNDVQTETKLANTYFNLAQNGHINQQQYASYAVQHYQNVLQKQPDNADVRTDMAIMEFTLGQTDQAIQDTSYVLQKKPDALQANFNLGIFYWQGRRDYVKAAAQMQKVIELTANDTSQQTINADAKSKLAQIKKEQASAESKGSAGATSTGGIQ